MSLSTLAESVILQAMEDLDNPEHRAESLDFFHGYRFRLFARMAGIPNEDSLGFRAYTKQYLHPFCAEDQPSRADRKVLRKMARASMKYRQPLFIHLMGSS